jgi:putative transposase
MSRKGNCYDNAIVESLSGTLKSEMVYQRKFATKAQARPAILDYIEGFHNRKRLHAALGYMRPEQLEAARCS